jgi:hypothetical protein
MAVYARLYAAYCFPFSFEQGDRLLEALTFISLLVSEEACLEGNRLVRLISTIVLLSSTASD